MVAIVSVSVDRANRRISSDLKRKRFCGLQVRLSATADLEIDSCSPDSLSVATPCCKLDAAQAARGHHRNFSRPDRQATLEGVVSTQPPVYAAGTLPPATNLGPPLGDAYALHSLGWQ